MSKHINRISTDKSELLLLYNDLAIPCQARHDGGVFGLLRRFAPRNDDSGLCVVLRLPRSARNDDSALGEDRSSRSLRSLRMTLFVMFGNATLRSRVGARTTVPNKFQKIKAR